MRTRSLLYFLLQFECVLWAQQAPPPLSPEEFLRKVRALPLPPAARLGRVIDAAGAGKIHPELSRLLDTVTARRADRAIADDSAVSRVAVVVRVNSLAQVADVESRIRSGKGEVNAVFENTVWAEIAPGEITALASLPSVASLAVQPADTLPPDPPGGQSARTMAAPADGVRAAHLQLLHRRGITGKGVRIGILDCGFARYSELIRSGKVRPARAQRSFPPGYGVENGEAHGTAAAEIVSAAAPDADLLLASFDGHHGQFLAAAAWLIAQGAGVISYSLGNATSASDGTDDISRFVDETSRRYGVLWVIAAGNHAEQHWAGLSADANHDGILETEGTAYGLAVTALSRHLTVVVRWDDWGANPRLPASTQDIDAYLYALDTRGALYEVARSTDIQNGGTARPLEIIELAGNNLPGHQYFLVLRARRVTRLMWVHVFLDPGGAGRIYPSTSAGSILSPAAARSALAVGAVDVLSDELAPYSSQGPTDDGRLKPEVTGPSNTISFAWSGDSGRFTGTSAAAPHVAAFAALVKQMNPRLSSSELRQSVLRAVIPRGSPHPNTSYGFGLIDGALITATQPRSSAPEPAGSVTVPEEFGGEVRASTLGRFRQIAGQPHDGLEVNVFSARDVYRIGDDIRAILRATEDCACLLFIRDSQGRYALVPHQGSPILLLQKGGRRTVPPPEDGAWRITGPAGIDELLLVCAAQPLALESALESDEKGAAIALSACAYQIVNAEHQ